MKQSTKFVVVAGLLLAACGGGESGDGLPATDAATEAEGTDVGDDADALDDGATAEQAPAAVLRQVATEADDLAAQLIARLGSDDAASDAVLRAVADGYATDQILGGVRTGSLAGDGSIDGVEPTSSPADLIQGLRRSTPPTTRPPLPVEELRRAVQEAAGDGDVLPVASGGTALLVGLLIVGFNGDQLVDAIVFGVDKTERNLADIDRLRPDCATDAAGRYVKRSRECERWWQQCAYEWTIAGELVDIEPCREPGSPEPGADDGAAAEAENDDAEPNEAEEPATTIDYSTGAWVGDATFTGGGSDRTTTYVGSAVVEFRDGAYKLSFETTSQSTGDCSSSTVAFGQIDGTPPDEFGKIFFTDDVTTDITSDCRFYESSGGSAQEVNTTTFVGTLRDDGVFVLENLVPASTVEMEWTPG